MNEKEYIAKNNHAHNRPIKIIRVPEDETNGGIVTPLSLSQSLSAPRAPPEGSIHRNVMLGKYKPAALIWNKHFTKQEKQNGQHNQRRK